MTDYIVLENAPPLIACPICSVVYCGTHPEYPEFINGYPFPCTRIGAHSKDSIDHKIEYPLHPDRLTNYINSLSE